MTESVGGPLTPSQRKAPGVTAASTVEGVNSEGEEQQQLGQLGQQLGHRDAVRPTLTFPVAAAGRKSNVCHDSHRDDTCLPLLTGSDDDNVADALEVCSYHTISSHLSSSDEMA